MKQQRISFAYLEKSKLCDLEAQICRVDSKQTNLLNKQVWNTPNVYAFVILRHLCGRTSSVYTLSGDYVEPSGSEMSNCLAYFDMCSRQEGVLFVYRLFRVQEVVYSNK